MSPAQQIALAWTPLRIRGWLAKVALWRLLRLPSLQLGYASQRPSARRQRRRQPAPSPGADVKPIEFLGGRCAETIMRRSTRQGQAASRSVLEGAERAGRIGELRQPLEVSGE